jgi:hypothetical protein
MNNKLKKLYEYSDPEEVNRKAMLLHLNEIHPSSRKDKKYMVFDGHKMIHFGQMGYEDYTYHGDLKRKQNFRKRNIKWGYASKYSPAWLSFYLLW